MSLTGKFCFRRTLWGKVILCVEEEKKAWFGQAGTPRKRWRDASLIDLTDHALRGLLELRDNAGSLIEKPRPIEVGGLRSAKLPAAADAFAWPYAPASDGGAILNGPRGTLGVNGERSEHSKSAA